MKMHLYPIAFPLLLALAACVPGVADYSRSEAPNQLRVDGAQTELDLAFAAGSDRLAAGQAARLERLVMTGGIGPADRVVIAAAGGPSLAQRRAAAVSGELLRYGIVADARPLYGVPANHAVVMIGRYAVTLPRCPNWSKSPSTDFTNAPSSNFGCADASNLGLMVASPGDLVSGRPLALADGMPAANAVDRYLHDQVKLPAGAAVGPIAASGGGDTPAAAPGGQQ